MFEKFFDELYDAMNERYKDIEDIKQTFEEMKLCIGTDPIRFMNELNAYILKRFNN